MLTPLAPFAGKYFAPQAVYTQQQRAYFLHASVHQQGVWGAAQKRKFSPEPDGHHLHMAGCVMTLCGSIMRWAEGYTHSPSLALSDDDPMHVSTAIDID
jgi:hypothetical protein